MRGVTTTTLTIRHLRAETMTALRARAERNHRSLQGEVLHILELTLGVQLHEPLDQAGSPPASALARKRRT